MIVSKTFEEGSISALETAINNYLSSTLCASGSCVFLHSNVSCRFDDNGGKYISVLFFDHND